jgi:WD40 repeat protein
MPAVSRPDARSSKLARSAIEPSYTRRFVGFPRICISGSIALLTAGTAAVFGYSVIGSTWSRGTTVVINLELGATNVALQDGLGTWNNSAANALALWNQHLPRLRFSWVNDSHAPIAPMNGTNTVSFASNVYGEGFGSDTLAVTVWWTAPSGSTREADVLVNRAFHFNSYRGPLRSNLYDFHRVALHEFGHVLGLDHPDEAGQSVTAIMNSVIGNLDSLAADDIAGATFLYGYRVTSDLSLPEVVRGDPFAYQISADNNPTSFTATGLPLGLILNRQTGRITGRPTIAGTYHIVLTAFGTVGNAVATLDLRVRPPSLTVRSAFSDIEVGDDVSFQISADGNPTLFSAVNLPAGWRIDSQTGLITGRATLSGNYDIPVTATSVTAGTVTGHLIVWVAVPVPQLVKKFPLPVNRLLVDSSRKRVYASVAESNAVAVLDANNLALIKLLPIQGEPKGMAMSPDGRRLFVANTAQPDFRIEVIDLSTLTARQALPVPFPTFDIEAGLSGRLFVTSWGANWGSQIVQIDSDTGVLLTPFPGTLPSGLLEISPDRNTLYIGAADFTPSTVTAVNVSGDSPTIRDQVPWNTISSVLLDLKLTHDGRFLFPVGYSAVGGLLKIPGDVLTEVSSHIPLPAGDFPKGPIAFSPNDGIVFVPAGDSVTRGFDVIDTATSRFFRTIETNQFYPSDMVVDTSGRFLFAGSPGFKSLRVYVTGFNNRITATPRPKSLLNVSTRLKTQPGDDVLIGGFVLAGNDPKRIAIRALGPSLPLDEKLDDPYLELYDRAGTRLTWNDNWNSQRTTAMLTGFSPPDEHESFITTTLQPGSYTAILRGAHSPSGVALFEVYDLTPDSNSKLANISTRGKVETGDNVMIGGFVIGGDQPTRVLIRAIGPSLSHFGVQGSLQDPVLELRRSNGSLIFQNDNWRVSQQAAILATGKPPTDNRESAIVATLQPGSYTAIVRGRNNSTGVALVEVYNLEQ